MFVLAIILSLILAGGFLTFGSMKVRSAPDMVKAADHLGLDMTKFKGIGGLEMAGGLGVLVGLIDQLEILGVLAGIGLAVTGIGAVAFHVKAGDKFQEFAPAIVMAVLSIGYVVVRSATA